MAVFHHTNLFPRNYHVAFALIGACIETLGAWARENEVSEEKSSAIIAAIESALAGWAQYFDIAYHSDLVDEDDQYIALFTIQPKPFDSDNGRVVGSVRTLEFSIVDGEVWLITGEDNEHNVTVGNLFAALYFDTLGIEYTETERDQLRQHVAELEGAMRHIAEYWNRDQNEKAMADAL